LKHYVLNAYGCENTLFCDEALDTLVLASASVARVLDTVYYHFEGGGYTALTLLAESHASIHTWPESGEVRYDIFTCGSVDPILAVHTIIEYIKPTHYNIEGISR
jgi:S-adenosylmethionine decarboxylase